MNLVLQGPGASAGDVHLLAKSTGAVHVEAIAENAYRLHGARSDAAIADWCDARRIDFAWVPAGRRWERLRLIALDMDSTLIDIECIDELGALAGRGAEIAAITEAAMRGDLPFGRSLDQRVALLAGLPEGALTQVFDERLRLSPGARNLVALCRNSGIATLLVSGGFRYFTDRLQSELGLDRAHANALEIVDSRLTGRLSGPRLDARAKADRLRGYAAELGIARDQTLAIGDGANDLAMLGEAGVSVAWRAKPLVRAAATHALDFAGLDAVRNFYE